MHNTAYMHMRTVVLMLSAAAGAEETHGRGQCISIENLARNICEREYAGVWVCESYKFCLFASF